MNRRTIVGIASVGVLLLTLVNTNNESRPNSTDAKSMDNHSISSQAEAQEVKQICDGTTTVKDCTVDGVNYSTYIYHAAVPEKTHTETTTTYQKKITGYCTLCNDGTYSPSCATGRGACSWHDGVAEWNAPMYSNVPILSTRTIVDEPAQAAYYEKVAE